MLDLFRARSTKRSKKERSPPKSVEHPVQRSQKEIDDRSDQKICQNSDQGGKEERSAVEVGVGIAPLSSLIGRTAKAIVIRQWMDVTKESPHRPG